MSKFSQCSIKSSSSIRKSDSGSGESDSGSGGTDSGSGGRNSRSCSESNSCLGEYGNSRNDSTSSECVTNKPIVNPTLNQNLDYGYTSDQSVKSVSNIK